MVDSFDRVGLAAGLDSAGVPWRELDEVGRRTYAVDGVEPFAMCWPGTASEVAASLQVADRLGVAISPRGSGTKVSLGNRPRACDLIVSTERLNRVIDYAPANLTVTVEAGVTLAALQSALAQGGQVLPIDPPHSRLATIGGVLAANASGPRRLGYGSGRDLVIGTRSATASGKMVRSGGRVVKNVAGYDLGKLYIGSLGTLVLLVEVNLKVTPIPASQTTVLGWFSSLEGLASAGRAVCRSALMPGALEVLNARAASAINDPLLSGQGGRYLLVALGTAPGGGAVRQADEFARIFRECGAEDVVQVADGADHQLWTAIGSLGESDAAKEDIALKAAVPPGQLLEAWRILEKRIPALGGNPAIFGRAGSGVFYVSWVPASASLNGHRADTVAGVQAIRREIVGLGGSLVVERCPTILKEHLDVWGNVGNSLGLMRNLKAALDPRGIMNPGRFVGEI